MGSKYENPDFPDMPDPGKILETEAKLNRADVYGPEGATQWVQGPDGRFNRVSTLSPQNLAVKNALLSMLGQPLYEGDPTAAQFQNLPLYGNPVAPAGSSSTFLPMEDMETLFRYENVRNDLTDEDTENPPIWNPEQGGFFPNVQLGQQAPSQGGGGSGNNETTAAELMMPSTTVTPEALVGRQPINDLRNVLNEQPIDVLKDVVNTQPAEIIRDLPLIGGLLGGSRRRRERDPYSLEQIAWWDK